MVKKTAAKKPSQTKGKTTARKKTGKRVTKRVTGNISRNVKLVKRKVAKKDRGSQTIKKSIGKLTVLFLIIGLNWSGLSAIGETLAYFNDTETFLESTYSAGTLDFSLSSDNDFLPLVTPTQTAARSIDVGNIGSLAFQYQASTSTFSGDLDLCDKLYLEVFLELEKIYSGSLLEFSLATSSLILATSTTQSLDFFVSLGTSTDSSLQDKTCNFDFEFQGWQEDQPSYNSEANFSDAEIISNSVTSSSWEHIVINKVYPDIDKEHGKEHANEWVEFYNPTDSPIDISGWLILDKNSEDPFPSSDPIPALGYGLITGASSTFDYWNIPDEAVKIVLTDGKIGNGLANPNDLLILKDGAGNIVDQMNWGTPSNGWPNYNSNVWDPGVSKAAGGNILSRNPNGYDTDQVSDWTEFSLPSVAVIIPNGGEVWHVGATSTIEWEAVNNNGDDSDLSIDIYYSSDSGNTWANVATSTENDGTYDWRVALCLDDGSGSCYWVPSARSRIKIVATDYTRNFMLTAWDGSDADFCPPILYDLLTDEELEMLEKMGLLPDDFVRNQETTGASEPTQEISEESEEKNLEETSQSQATSTLATSTDSLDDSGSASVPEDNNVNALSTPPLSKGALDTNDAKLCEICLPEMPYRWQAGETGENAKNDTGETTDDSQPEVDGALNESEVSGESSGDESSEVAGEETGDSAQEQAPEQDDSTSETNEPDETGESMPVDLPEPDTQPGADNGGENITSGDGDGEAGAGDVSGEMGDWRY